MLKTSFPIPVELYSLSIIMLRLLLDNEKGWKAIAIAFQPLVFLTSKNNAIIKFILVFVYCPKGLLICPEVL